jgi:glycosyltransferase involved in cell wall biosynthesis
VSIHFSVVIPTYQREVLLLRAVASVLNQSYENFEIIIVDNDSSELLAKNDLLNNNAKIRYFDYSTKKGASSARNKGIAEAKGEIICFLDDDDEYYAEMLTEINALFSDHKNTADFAWCGVEKIFTDPDDNHRSEIFHINSEAVTDRSFVLRVGTGCGLCVYKKCLIDVGSFNEEMTVSEDRDLLLKLLSAGYQGKPVASVLHKRYYHFGERLSTSVDQQQVNFDSKLYQLHQSYIDAHPALKNKLFDQLGLNYFLAGEFQSALNTSLAIWKESPFRVKAIRRLIRFKLATILQNNVAGGQ